MDWFNDPEKDEGAFMKSAQVGATELLNNMVGYIMDQDPGPMLLLQPTIDMGKAWSKDRLAPMLRDTPALQDKVGERRAKDTENTILHKVFPGGHITIAGANSPASLASRPIRVVLADEVDRYPESAGAEGDPLNLAFKRTTTFYNRKRLVTSTPTIAGESRIEAAFEESDQRFYYVPCVHCEEQQRLIWAQVVWDKDQDAQGNTIQHYSETAHYCCEHCGALMNDAQLMKAVTGGEWIATHPERRKAGWHINEIYSPWVKLSEMVAGFLEAKKLPETLKTWTNTSLGEVWDEDAEQIDSDSIEGRSEPYEIIPQGAYLLLCSVDVQDNRLEAYVKAWGLDEEGWAIAHEIFYGDPALSDVWTSLSDFLKTKFEHVDGYSIEISATGIDSGGHFTNEVYKFCKNRNRTYALKGVGGIGRPAVGRPSKANKMKCEVFPLGVDSIKDVLFSRLKVKKPGPGFQHYPDAFEREFFEQLTSEKKVKKKVRGRSISVWKQIRTRNEAWDLEVYQIGVKEILNPNMKALADKAKPKEKPKPKPRTGIDALAQRKRRQSFVNSWR